MRWTIAAICSVVTLTTIFAGAREPAAVELRGAWAWGRSFGTKNDADKLLARARAMNLNALFFLSFYHGATTCHRSRMAPMNPKVAEGFDPLGYVAGKARAAGIEVHVWFVNGKSTMGGILREHGDWRAMDLSGRRIDWFDLCNPAVRDWQAKLMIEVLEAYDVAGVHFDYIRFNGKSVCTCPVCRRRAAAEGIDIAAMLYPKLPSFGHYSGNPLAEPTTAKVLAEFGDGVPAVAVNRVGKGEVVLFNWHAQRSAPQAISVAMRRAFERLGVKRGESVLVLRSAVNAVRYGYRAYAAAVRIVRDLGFAAKRVDDAGLARLRAGAVVLLPNHYLMTDAQAQALLAHVKAGGGAVFIDGPVFAMRKSEAARELLGFRRSGKYFNGDRILLSAGGEDNFVPGEGQMPDPAAERAKHARWTRWRKQQITQLVADVRRRAKRVKARCLVTAAVFRTQDAAEGVCQDWPRWLRDGLLDYAVPMAYVPTAAELEGHFEWWKEIDPRLERIVPGIGAYKIGADEPAAKRAALIGEQIDVCRKQGAHGFVMFVLEKIDDATAAALGRGPLRGKARAYRPPAPTSRPLRDRLK